MTAARGGSYRRYTGNAEQAKREGIPDDNQMRSWRMAGKFICQCADAQPTLIGAWASYECRRCGKPYFGSTPIGEELIRSVLDEVDGDA